MTRSMTGFGRATGEFNGDVVSVELSSVNHRYLDCSVRLPTAWSALESVAKQTVRAQVVRGKVTVTISRKRSNVSHGTVQFDSSLAAQYIDASKQLAHLLGSYETLSLNVLAELEGVFAYEEPEEDLELAGNGLKDVLEGALSKLNSMRATEGRLLADDMRQRIVAIRALLAGIEQRLPLVNEMYEKRLRARIVELKGDMAIAEDRIVMEVAALAEKSDATEEVVRFKTHLEHMIELIDSDDAVGRQLDFLIQELQREANTLGVKTRDADVAKDVIRIKSEIEKIREQVQNIE